MKSCQFKLPYHGPCGETITTDNKFCPIHLDVKCRVCGNQASQKCDQDQSNLICGVPTCKEHRCPYHPPFIKTMMINGVECYDKGPIDENTTPEDRYLHMKPIPEKNNKTS